MPAKKIANAKQVSLGWTITWVVLAVLVTAGVTLAVVKKCPQMKAACNCGAEECPMRQEMRRRAMEVGSEVVDGVEGLEADIVEGAEELEAGMEKEVKKANRGNSEAVRQDNKKKK